MVQAGVSGETPRSRSFTYDSLSRLLTSTNPETGTICYGTTSNQAPTASNCQPNGYDANGNLIYRTDATGQTTSYQYDALNRMTFSFKPDGTSNGWGYDGNDENGNPIAGLTNSIGRLSHISNRVNAAENFGYDPMGRLNLQSACLPSACNYTTQVSALYDLAGNMTDLTYPDGHRAHFDIGSDGRVKDVGDGTVTGNYAQSLLYNPDGSLGTLVYGNGALQQVITQNNRLQLQSMAVTDPLSQNATTYLSRTYCYVNCVPQNTANNGNIWGITDNLNGSRTQGFTYDNLNRISSFSLGGQLAQQYSIDSFGNMSGMVNGQPTTTFDPATNRISNLPCASSTAPYDAKGNQLCSTDQNGMVSQYVYDTENQLSSINTLNGNASPFARYIYGADGQRVRKQNQDGSVFTEYVSFNGQTIAEKDQAGNWTDYVFANGNRIARVSPSMTRAVLTGVSNGSDPNMIPIYNLAIPADVANYTIQSNDVLGFRNFQHNIGNWVSIGFTDGSNSDWYCGADQHGDCLEQESTSDQWVDRTVQIGSFAAGKKISYIFLAGHYAPQGSYTLMWSRMNLIHQDGTVSTLIGDVTGAPLGWCAYAYNRPDGTISCNSETDTPQTATLSGDTTATTTFYVSDHLGSATMELASGGWPISSTQYGPFGAELPASTSAANHYKFTGKERDAESGLDYFGARYYGSNIGRFMNPDWNSSPDEIPYADIRDPQSLNLYSYVKNNPLRQADPDGHCCVEEEETTETGTEVGAEIGTFFGPEGTVIGGVLGGAIGLGAGIYADYKITHYMMGKGGNQNHHESDFQSYSDEELEKMLKDPTTSTNDREKIVREQKARATRNAAKRGGKKQKALPVKNDPASVRARQQQQQQAKPAPTPMPTPDPPKPPKDKHGEPS